LSISRVHGRHANERPAPASVPLARWQWVWLVIAALSFAPTAYHAHQSIQDTTRDLRVQLIQRYSLWEVDRQYRGTPQSWTRFAAWLLNTEQLMQRVQEKYGKLTPEIEQDFERDTAFAVGRVVAIHAVAWGAPVGLLYAIGWLYARRRARERQPPISAAPREASRRRA
jgi:hypothetical protein